MLVVVLQGEFRVSSILCFFFLYQNNFGSEDTSDTDSDGCPDLMDGLSNHSSDADWELSDFYNFDIEDWDRVALAEYHEYILEARALALNPEVSSFINGNRQSL